MEPSDATKRMAKTLGAEFVETKIENKAVGGVTHPLPPVVDDGRQGAELIAPLVLRTEPQSSVSLGHSASVTAKGERT